MKIIFLDLDGTITDKEGRLPFESINAIRKLKEKGFLISAASANSYCVIRTLNRYFKLFDFIIAESGGVLDNKKEIKLLADKQIAIKAISILKEKFPNLFEHWSNPMRLSDQAFRRPEDEELIKKVKDYVSQSNLGIKIIDTGYSLEITQKEVSKGKAAKILLEELGIDKVNSYAIGDSEADIELFMVVDYPIALANSSEELKKISKIKVNKEYYHGFIEAVELL